jgi:hypothetical protein
VAALARVERRIRNVSNSGTLDHVADLESLDCLVLWHTAMAIGAAQRIDMATAVLVATAISSFLSLINASVCIVIKATRSSCHFGDFKLREVIQTVTTDK